jgi:hypothetical protein
MKRSSNHSSAVLLFTAVISLLGVLASAAADGVFAVNVTGKARFQDGKVVRMNCRTVEGQRTCDTYELALPGSFAINNKVLINLATSNSPASTPPRNLILAARLGCEGGASLLLYDTATSNILATIAEVVTSHTILTSKVFCETTDGERTCETRSTAYEALGALTFSNIGNEGTNSINGGSLTLSLSGPLDGGECPSKMIANGLGSLDLTFTRPERDAETGQLVDQTSSATLLVQSVTLTTARKLPVVIEQPPN